MNGWICTKVPSPSVSLPGDDGQMWWTHARPHEQHHVLVARVAVRHHLALEGLELVLVVALDVDQADGHLAVPATVEHLAEAPLADHLPDLQLLDWDVPLLQEDAGLASLAWEVASRQKRQVHLLELVTGVLVVTVLVLRQDKLYLYDTKRWCKLRIPLEAQLGLIKGTETVWSLLSVFHINFIRICARLLKACGAVNK